MYRDELILAVLAGLCVVADLLQIPDKFDKPRIGPGSFFFLAVSIQVIQILVVLYLFPSLCLALMETFEQIEIGSVDVVNAYLQPSDSIIDMPATFHAKLLNIFQNRSELALIRVELHELNLLKTLDFGMYLPDLVKSSG